MSNLYCSSCISEFRNLFDRFYYIQDKIMITRIDLVKDSFPHILVAWLVNIYQRHSNDPRSVYYVIIDMRMIFDLNSSLQVFYPIFCLVLGYAMLYHKFGVSIKYFVKVNCCRAQWMVC